MVPLDIKRLILKIFPAPSVSIYVYNSPEILIKRRPRERIWELNRQMEIFNYMNPTYSLKTDNMDTCKESILYIEEWLQKNWY